MSSSCDLVDHVRTQLPYALVVAVVALAVGEIPAALEWIHPVWAIMIGIVVLWGILRIWGRDPAEGLPSDVRPGSGEIPSPDAAGGVP